MNVIKFNENNRPQNKKIVYCIIDKTSLYTDQWAKELVKNISDWTIQNLTIKGYTVLVSTDEESLLKELTNLEYSYAVMLATGTEFINGYAFLDEVEKFCADKHFFVAGHILDRKDLYYELHEQCYIINLTLWKQQGCPAIGQEEYYSEHTQLIPNRSDDNLHDDYTPLWVAKGTVTQTYQHKRHGWNILSAAFNANLPVVVFNKQFRNNKKYYYPEYTKSFLNEINYAYNRDSFCSGLAVYPFNSEVFIKNPMPAPIEQLVVPASGLNWVFKLEEYGFNENTVIKFFDYSLPTLQFMKELINNWDGTDYPTFVNNHIQDRFGFLENNKSIPYCGPTDLVHEWNEILRQTDWPTLWNKVKTLKFEFHWVNLLDSSASIDWIDQGKNTLVNASNIFNYIGTATFYNVKSRVNAENSFIRKLKERIPNCYVIITRRAGSGFIDYTTNWPLPINAISETDIEDLIKPTWHMNRDWTI